MYVIIGSHFVPLEGKFSLIELATVRLSIIQILAVKLSNSSTTFSQQMEITLSKCLIV